MQKSISGLYRSLLHDVLKTCPSLIQDTLPDLWNQAERAPWQVQKRFIIPARAIEAALRRVLTDQGFSTRLFESHRFCFFIDGLDEHEESYNQDHRHLVELLKGWVIGSHGNLKICVSSRDYNVFLNGFSDNQRLQLPELTRFDMRDYVRDALSHLTSKKLKENFIRKVPLKADGIFLWAVLVVGAIRRQNENGVSEEKLLKLLDTVPSRLETLFLYILHDLDEGDRRTAYQILGLLMVTKENMSQRGHNAKYLNLANFSLLDDYNVDEEFSIKDSFPSPGYVAEWSRVNPATYAKRLRGSCGGLIECGDTRDGATLKTHVDFSHRSIPDVLQKRSIKQDMETVLGNFNAIDALSHLLFAEEQLLDYESSYRHGDLCAQVARIRLKNHLDKPPYRLLEAMESWIGRSIEEPRPNRSVNLECGQGRFIEMGYSDTKNPSHDPYHEKTYFLYSTLYLALWEENLEYVKWKIENSPSVLDTVFKRNLLASLVLGYPICNRLSKQDLDYFFEIGLLTEQCNNNLTIVRTLEYAVPYTREDHTNWQRYLASSFLVWCGLGKVLDSSGPGSGFDADRFFYIATKFLEDGATAEFSVTIQNFDHSEHDILFHFENMQMVGFIERQVRACKLEHTAIWYQRSGKKTLSLREWISAMRLEREHDLLSLLHNAEAAEIYDDESSEKTPGRRLTILYLAFLLLYLAS